MTKYALFLGAVLLTFVSVLSYAQAPVPFINQPLVPDATAPGGPQFTLTVNGTGFVSNSVVNWNGSALATQFVSGSQLTATVPASDIATASTASVTVVNPPPGGGTSNVSFFTVTPNTGNFVGFYLARSLAGGTPLSVAVGDFNGDGKTDLAVTNYYDPTVSILLGDGTGNFTLASSPGVGSGPNSVAVGDFNGDGKLDLAVANMIANTVSILLGDGSGNFTLVSSPATGWLPESVAVGDFNRDGKLDLAVANFNDSNVSILLGDGTGNFTLASSLAADCPFSVAVGDFNGDGRLDLAVVNFPSGTVSILLGDGTGNFTLASSPRVGAYPQSVAVGDFNGDGKLDLAVSNWYGNTVSILLGVPPGPFVGLSPASLTFGTQLLGTSSAPQQVTLTNIGSMPVDITKAGISANFSQTNNCPHELAPGGQCTANVVFTPHNINTIRGTITITDNAPNSPQTIPLTGVGTAVTLLPSSLDFGKQQAGTISPPQTVTLTNYAPKAVTILGDKIAGDSPSSFEVQNSTCSQQLPAGQSCTFGIAFAPKGYGIRDATFGVRDNGGASPQTVALSGTGTK